MSSRLAKKAYKARQYTNDVSQQNNGYNDHMQPQQKNDQKMPRPIIPSEDNIYVHDKSSYKKGKLAFPPAQSLYVSQNIYDAGPDFVRPTSAVMLGNPKKTQFPFGAWISPFGSQKVTTIRANAPLRCSRCKAYVNAYFRFDGTKSSAICNICGISFQIDHQSVDSANLNTPQLATQGIVDFVVSDKRFMRKRLQIIKIVLLIEIGTFMSESGAFNTILESLRVAVQNSQFQPNIRIGVVLYNGQGITYLKLRNNQKWAQSLPRKYQIKYSATGLCNPLSDKQMYLDPNNEKQKLIYLLNCVQQIGQDFYKNSKYATYGANYGAALKSLLNNFQNETGKVILFSHCTPKSGPLGIRARNNQDVKNPLKPLTQQYYELAKQYLQSKVGIQMYAFGKQSIMPQQFPTIHYLCSLTGGSLKFYSPYNAENHGENLYYEVYGALTRKCVYDVDFTARVSNGLNIASFGAFEGIRQTRDVGLSIMDTGASIMFTFQHEQKIQQNSSAFLQYAMMYTNGYGERRVRIINYRYFITNKISVLHQASDYLAVSNIILRQALSKANKNDPLKVREQVVNRLIAIIAQYSQQSGGIIKGSVFMAHPNFAPALAYIHNVLNSRIFLQWSKTSVDYRIYQMLKLNKLNFFQYANYVYPKLYSLGLEIYDNEPVPGEIVQGQHQIQQSAVLPPNLPLTHDSLAKNGVFMHVSCDYIMILVMPQASQQLLQDIFGTNNWQQIEQNGLPELETAHNIRINIMVQQIRRRNSMKNGIYLPILVRTPKKKAVFKQLQVFITKQDVVQLKYFSFLDLIHRQVQTRIK